MARSKKVTILILIAVLVLSMGSIGVVFGESLNDINTKIKDKESKLEQGKQKESELSDEVKSLEASIAQTEAELTTIVAEISDTQTKIDQVTQELEQLQDSMNQQNVDLNSRLRVMYKNGEVGVIQILLSSSDITDFLANLDMIKTIHKNDVDILKVMEAQHDLIATQHEELEALKASIEAKRLEQASKQSSLEQNKTEVAMAKSEVAEDNIAIFEQIQALEAEAAALKVEIPQLTDPEKVYNNASGWAWPVPSSRNITSPYGPRIHPISKKQSFHTGIDIGASYGSAIVAAKEGTVVSSGSRRSYGNTVIIDHGGGITTLYAHNSSNQVSAGQTVSAGQRIASIGETGDATGPHLHFEVRVNGQDQNPRNWV